MEVNCFQILLIDVIFYLFLDLKVVLDVLIKIKTRIYVAPAVKGLTTITKENKQVAWQKVNI